MSDEASRSTQQTPEEDVEVQQESQPSNPQPGADSAADLGQAAGDVYFGTENADSATVHDISDQPAVPDESVRPQEGESTSSDGERDQPAVPDESVRPQEGESTSSGSERDQPAVPDENVRPQEGELTSSDSVQDSQGSSGISGAESPRDGAIGGAARLQVSPDSAASPDSGTESMHGLDTQILDAIAVLGPVCIDPNRQDSQDSSTSSSQEAAVISDSSNGISLESGVAGGISSSSDSQENPNGQDSQGGAASSSSRTGNSEEASASGDSSGGASLDRGVADGKSSSSDSHQNSDGQDSQDSSAASRSRNGNSEETAVAGDSSSGASLDRGVADGKSSSTDSRQNSNGQDSQDSSAASRSRNGNSEETAVAGDSSSGTLPDSGAAVAGDSSSGALPDSGTAVAGDSSSGALLDGGSAAGSIPGGVDSGENLSLRDSMDDSPSGSFYESAQETLSSYKSAIAGDSSREFTLGSGVAGGISNITDSQDSLEGARPPSLIGRIWGRRPRAPTPRVSRGNVCRTCASICDYMRPYSNWIRKSKTFMTLRILLGLMSFVTVFMGGWAICPVETALPLLMMTLGCLGFIFLTFWIGYDCDVLCSNGNAFFKRVLVLLGTVLFGLFLAGLTLTLRMDPSFDFLDKTKYCSKTFYYYVYYTNIGVGAFVALSVFILAPTFCERGPVYEEL